MLKRTRQDVRYAARALARSPLFTTIAVLSIAIGIGATTAIVTLANTLLLRPPPGVGHPENVVIIGRTQDGSGFDNLSYPNFLDYRAAARTLSDMAIVRMDPMTVSLAGPDGGEPIQASIVSGNFFRLLEARPAAGRFFLPEEDRAPGANPVVVLSHAFWRSRFQNADTIVGSTVVLNGTPFTVVGVGAERFRGPFVMAPDVWVPVMASTLLGASESTLARRQSVWAIALGRLAPNTGVAAAQAELGAIAAGLEREYPEENRGQGVRVTAASLFPGDLRAMVGGFLVLLLAVSGLVLLIASTNVAGMLLARAATRQREIAVRLALGASRAQLVQQLVTEGLLLFLIAGVAGVLLARWLVVALMALVPRLPVQLAFDPRMDWLVLGFALGASLLTGLLAGTVPALQSTRPQLVPALKNEAAGGATLRLRSTLLTVQIAFSMLLLIVAALFARALAHAHDIDPGFDARGVEVASLDLGLANYDAERGGRLAATLLEQVRALPGVDTAALVAVLPLGGSGLGLGGITIEGRAPEEGTPGGPADWNVVTPGYFATIGIPLVQGRDFTDADRSGAPEVAILNETLARHLWPGQNPLGRTIRNDDRTLTVVGVARDAKYRSLGEAPRNFIYVTLAQRYMGRTTLLVKAAQGAALTQSIRRLVADLDPSLPILNQQMLAEQAAVSLFPQRLALNIAGGLSGVALLLALLGIYGVTAYDVTRRTREIGIRIALGAQRSSVVGMVLRQGLMLAIIGAAAGGLAALVVTRLLSGMLYGIPATDPVAFGAAAAILVFAAVLASAIPARRAAGLDPVNALRRE
ncbi:MAG TPA: ABC transporter permease [Vicinamibacterales bacterium]|nr:ABC transporter permease [Vicinamibacterales bacterium]